MGRFMFTDDTDLSYHDFRSVNVSRALRWHASDDGWTGVDWSNAMGGECGEAQNVVKKLRRLELGVQGRLDPDEDTLRAMLADELGDVIAYVDLLAWHYDIDLAEAVRSKFNRISEREGMPERVE